MAITATRITATPPTATRPTAMQINAGGGGEVCRNVSNFNGVDSYAQFDNDIVLTGDFEIELETLSDISGGAYFLADINAMEGRIAIQSNGVILVTSATDSTSLVMGAQTGVIERKLIIKRVAGIYSAMLNDDTSNVPSSDTSTIVLNSLASKWGSASSISFLNGTIKNVKVWTGGDRGTGTLLVDLPMDETSETSTVNYVNRTGNTDYNATGYNITVTEECETNTNNLVSGGDDIVYQGDNVVV